MDEDYATFGGGLDEEELVYPDNENESDNVGAGLFVGETSATHKPTEVDVLSVLNEDGCGSQRSVRAPFRELRPDEYPPDDIYVHPIDWHMKVPDFAEIRAKEVAVEDEKREAVERLARRIHEYREALQNEQELKHVQSSEYVPDENIEKATPEEIMESPPIDGTPWMGVSTDGNGRRLYIRRLRPRKSARETCASSCERARRMNVLGTPLLELLTEAAQMRRHLESEKSRTSHSHSQSGVYSDSMYSSSRAESPFVEDGVHSNSTVTCTTASTAESSLWVDKYRPRGYAELLSDESVNRTLVTWLKLWDECVFKRKIISSTGVNEKEREMFAMEAGSSNMKRPHYKAILLAGPAGLGKTTLASIVARHAGYSVYEVNASDNRNVGDMEKLMDGAARTKRTLDKDSRPVCLVIDEVDGATAESVRWLCRQMQNTGRKALKRPIIAICNNLFAPCLRELRQNALCISMNPTKKDALVDRLLQLCDRESVNADRTVLNLLVDLCGSDMRLSINTLQYVSSMRKGKDRPLTEELVTKAVEQDRMGATSIFDNWSLILELGKHVDRSGIPHVVKERVRRVQRVAMDYGGDRFVAGLHCNYLCQNPPLPVATIKNVAQQFVYYDLVNSTIQEKQNYSLSKYLLAFYVQLHLSVATHTKMKMLFPHVDINSVQKRKDSLETLSAVRGHMIPSSYPPTTLLTEVLPFVLVIAQPLIKPMNESLYGKREREQLRTVVRILCDFGITFSPHMVKNQLEYLFNPSVDLLTMFNLGVVTRIIMPNAVRQMIAHEVDLEGVRRGSIPQGESDAATIVEEPELQEDTDKAKRKRAWDSSPIGRIDHKKAKVVKANPEVVRACFYAPTTNLYPCQKCEDCLRIIPEDGGELSFPCSLRIRCLPTECSEYEDHFRPILGILVHF